MKWIIRLLSVAFLCSFTSLASGADVRSLEKELQKIRDRFPGDMAVYVKNLATGEEIALDGDRVYETFSVIKVPIMAELLRQAESGTLSLSNRIEVKPSNARWPSGVLYTMDAGLKPTIKDLMTLMIIISDNAATDILGDKVGRANVTRTMRNLGLEKTTIEFSDLDYDRAWLGNLDPGFRSASSEKIMAFPFEKYSDEQAGEAFRRVIEEGKVYFGHSTVREMGRLFELMATGKLVSKKASDLMLATLKKQQVNNRFPRYLRDVNIAHKTGDGQPFIANDAGILWVRDQPIVLVVFTGHHRGETAALHDSIARIAALVVRHYGGSLLADYKDQ